MTDLGAWAGKRVVVTGGAGFLGRRVVETLRRAGASDVSVVRSAAHDLRRWDACLDATRGADVVIHLAARVGGIGFNRRSPGTLFYDNAAMGIQMIEAARQHRVGRFVAVGTVCSYPKYTPVPFREADLWNGYPEETNAPYGLAKKMLLVQLEAYRQQYGFDGIYLIPVNLYGPGDNVDLEDAHVIPAIVRKCVEAVRAGRDEVTLWGDGTPTREFLYVDDAAEAIVLAAERYRGTDPVNLGSGAEVSIRDLASMIAEMAGFRGRLAWDTRQPNGQPRRQLDTTRAREAFGFVAKTPLREGLAAVVAWFRGRVLARPRINGSSL